MLSQSHHPHAARHRAILGNAVNLLIFAAGRLRRHDAADRPARPELAARRAVANALPQALILTAIVICFSFFIFLLVLAYRAYQALGTDDTDGMRLAAETDERLPPLGY